MRNDVFDADDANNNDEMKNEHQRTSPAEEDGSPAPSPSELSLEIPQLILTPSSSRSNKSESTSIDSMIHHHNSNSNSNHNVERKDQHRHHFTSPTVVKSTAGAASPSSSPDDAGGGHRFHGRDEEEIVRMVTQQDWAALKVTLRNMPKLVLERIVSQKMSFFVPPTTSGTSPTAYAPSLSSQSPSPKTYLLHAALTYNPPVEVVQLILKEAKDVLQKVGPDGMLPLHIACTLGPDARLDVISLFIELHPPALRWREPKDDCLPLHLAVQHQVNDDVLMELLTAYPEGSLIKNAHDETPVDIQATMSSSPVSPSALDMAPILLKAAQAAQSRVSREHERKVTGLRDAHAEYIRQLEERYEEQTSVFVTEQIELNEQLASEKERNISLVETVMEMKFTTESLQGEIENCQRMIDDQRKQFDDHLLKNEKELERIMSIAGACVDKNKDGEQQARGGLKEESEEDEKKQDEDHNDGSNGFNDEEDDRKSTKSSSLVALAELVEDLKSHIEVLNTARDETGEQLRYKEDMIRHLNQLLAQKDDEIHDLRRQLNDKDAQYEDMVTKFEQLQNDHETMLSRLNSIHIEANRMKKVNQEQQTQIEKSKRTMRVQEKRLASIKSLVSSLNFNIESWSDDDDNQAGTTPSDCDECEENLQQNGGEHGNTQQACSDEYEYTPDDEYDAGVVEGVDDAVDEKHPSDSCYHDGKSQVHNGTLTSPPRVQADLNDL